jgi:hypothetical protein
MHVMCGLEKFHPAGSWNGWMMTSDSIMDGLLWCLSYRLVDSAVLINYELFTFMSRTMVYNNGPYGEDLLYFVRYSGLFFVGVLMYTFRSSVCFK